MNASSSNRSSQLMQLRLDGLRYSSSDSSSLSEWTGLARLRVHRSFRTPSFDSSSIQDAVRNISLLLLSKEGHSSSLFSDPCEAEWIGFRTFCGFGGTLVLRIEASSIVCEECIRGRRLYIERRFWKGEAVMLAMFCCWSCLEKNKSLLFGLFVRDSSTGKT